MSTVVSSIIPAALADEMDQLVEESGGHLSKSAVLRTALEEYVERVKVPQVTVAQTPLGSREGPSDKEVVERFRQSFVEVLDFVPSISTRGETGQCTVAFAKDTLRAIDVLLALPGIRQKTRADLIRALVHYGLQAVDHMQHVDHPVWRTAMVVSRQREALEKQLSISEDLYAGALALRDSLSLACARGVNDQALGLWLDYYSDAILMPPDEQAIMLRVLKELPIAQQVAWDGRNSGLIPMAMVPIESPDGWAVDTEEGLPVPPQLRIKRDLQAAYARGYFAGQRRVETADIKYLGEGKND